MERLRIPAWRAAIQRLIDDPGLLSRLCTNVQPPMTMEEHVERLEALYAQASGNGSGKRAGVRNDALQRVQ